MSLRSCTTTTDQFGRFRIETDTCGAILGASAPGYHLIGVEGWSGCHDGPGRFEGVRISMQGASTLAFTQQPSSPGDYCRSRPQGRVCLVFEDDYRWLVGESITGSRSGGYHQGNPVSVAIGTHTEFHHVLNTDLVATVKLP